MVDQIVLFGSANESSQFGGIFEGVQVFFIAEESFPLFAVFTPARSPQGDQIALRQPELDRNDVLCHYYPPDKPLACTPNLEFLGDRGAVCRSLRACPSDRDLPSSTCLAEMARWCSDDCQPRG